MHHGRQPEALTLWLLQSLEIQEPRPTLTIDNGLTLSYEVLSLPTDCGSTVDSQYFSLLRLRAFVMKQ